MVNYIRFINFWSNLYIRRDCVRKTRNKKKKSPLRRAGFWTALTAAALAGTTYTTDGVERYINEEISGLPCFVQPFVKGAVKSKITKSKLLKPVCKGWKWYKVSDYPSDHYSFYGGIGATGLTSWGLGSDLHSGYRKKRRKYR